MEKIQYVWHDGNIAEAMEQAAAWLKLMELDVNGVIAIISQFDEDTGYTLMIVYREKVTR